MTDQDATETANERMSKGELQALFDRWESGEEPEPGAPEAYSRRLKRGVLHRLIVSLVLIGITAFVMYQTRYGFSYWLQSDDPVELGDLRARWIAGETTLTDADNAHARAKNMVITRRRLVRSPEGEQLGQVFYCPLYGVVVQTERALPEVERSLWVEIDGRYKDIVAKKLAWPEELTVAFEARGRLLRAVDAPPNAARAVGYYADMLDADPSTMWVMLDGDIPEDYDIFAIVWLLAAVVPLVSLFFLIRAVRIRRRAER